MFIRFQTLLFAAIALIPGVLMTAIAAEPELISRDALFGNPARASVQMSPDGKSLSWVAPVEIGRAHV